VRNNRVKKRARERECVCVMDRGIERERERGHFVVFRFGRLALGDV